MIAIFILQAFTAVTRVFILVCDLEGFSDLGRILTLSIRPKPAAGAWLCYSVCEVGGFFTGLLDTWLDSGHLSWLGNE